MKDKPLKDSKTSSSELKVSTLVKFNFPPGKDARQIFIDNSRKLYILAGDEILQVMNDGELKFIVKGHNAYEQRESIVFDKQGNLYQTVSERIYKQNLGNLVPLENPYGELVATFPERIRSIALDDLGNVYAAGIDRKVYKFTPNKEIIELPINKLSELNGVSLERLFRNVKSMVTDKEGNLYLACDSQIAKITTQGEIVPFVGGGFGYKEGVGQNASFKAPYSLVYGVDNNLYISDTETHIIRKITLNGEVSWFAGRRTKGFADGTLKEAQFKTPFSMATDNEGIFYIIDFENKALRVIKRDDQEVKLNTDIPKFTIPKAETLFWVYEERGTSCGLVEKDVIANELVTKVNVEEVLELLENPKELSQVITCLILISRILIKKPEFSERAEKALLSLLTDSRSYSAKVDNFSNHFIGMVGHLANLAYCQIIKGKKNLDEQISDLTWCIYGVMENELSEQMIYNPFYTFHEIGKNLDPKVRQQKVKEIGDIFCDIIADKLRPTSQRIKAYEAITKEISNKRDTKDIFGEVRQKAAKILVQIYTNQEENQELRNYIKKNLNIIAPEEIERLQKKELISYRDIPDIKELFAYSSVDSSKVNSFASEVSAQEVLEILQNSRTMPIDKLLAAIYLAPIVARRYNWRAFVHSLTNLVSVYKEYRFEVNRYNVTLELSKVSSDNLLSILKERSFSDKNIVFEYTKKLMEMVFDRGFKHTHYTDIEVWTIKELFNNLDSKESLNKFLEKIFLSNWLSPAARYLAYTQGDWNDKALHQKGWDLLLDPNEDDDLRALLGTTMHSYLKERVESLVDTSQTPWQLLPKSPTSLPISNPKELVPETWLMCTLTLAKDYEVLRQTINNLAKRIGVEEKYNREEINFAREKVLAYVEKFPNLKNILKRMCKRKKVDGTNIAIVAARMLALLGDTTEEDTIVDIIASGLDGWTTIEPFSSNWSGMNLLMTVLASNKVSDNVYSAFEPYIIVGYGDDKAKLIISKVFVVLAQSYEKEGDKEKALRAYKWAIKRDGLNLVARQGLKKLEEEK